MEFSTWTDAQLAGQRLMAGFDGTHMDAALEHLITGLRVGGLILFRRNIASPEQVAGLCRAAQACARGSGLPPLFIAIDQEGGQVARLGPPFTQFAGNPAMRDEADAARFAEITATELTAVGINMNLAPVVDVAPEGMDSIMAGRAFGSDPHAVARLGGTVIDGLQSRRIMAVAKHFPGIGRTTLDSHRDRPVLDADLAALEAFDLVPFRAAVDRAVAGIMLAPHPLHPPGSQVAGKPLAAYCAGPAAKTAGIQGHCYDRRSGNGGNRAGTMGSMPPCARC